MLRFYILLFLIFVLIKTSLANEIDSLALETNLSHSEIIDNDRIEKKNNFIRNAGFTLNTISFFRNDEYSSRVIKDYTLPGFRLRAALFATFGKKYPFRIKIGADNLTYWGAYHYPEAPIYRDLPYWKGANPKKDKYHITPIMSIDFMPNENWLISIGTQELYDNHELIEALYNPKLRYMADAENGVRLKYRGDRFRFQTWIDWQSFIFNRDRHPEAFLFGFSSSIKLFQNQNNETRLPLQATAFHRGGKTNDLMQDTVHTTASASIGIEHNYLISKSKDMNLKGSINLLGYKQRGDHFPVKQGWGLFSSLSLQNDNMLLSLDGYYSRGFLAPLASPFIRSFDRDGKLYCKCGKWGYISASAFYLHKSRSYDFKVGGGIWYLPMLKNEKFSFYIDLSSTFSLETLFYGLDINSK